METYDIDWDAIGHGGLGGVRFDFDAAAQNGDKTRPKTQWKPTALTGALSAAQNGQP